MTNPSPCPACRRSILNRLYISWQHFCISIQDMKQTLLFFIGFCILTSQAFSKQEPTESLPTPLSTGYEEEATAARSALQIAVDLSRDVEYGGCIYIHAGLYHFTEPVTSNSSESFNAGCQAPQGSKFMALFHTHPAGAPKGFSENDINTAAQTSLTSYVAELKSMTLFRYIHGKNRIKKRGYSFRGKCGNG